MQNVIHKVDANSVKVLQLHCQHKQLKRKTATNTQLQLHTQCKWHTLRFQGKYLMACGWKKPTYRAVNTLADRPAQENITWICFWK